MGKRLILKVNNKREFTERFTEICVGVFELTKKEVLILNELQIHYLSYQDKETSYKDTCLLMYTKLDSIKEELSINDFGFKKHIRNLKKKSAIFIEDNSLVINSFLIPVKNFSIEFNIDEGHKEGKEKDGEASQTINHHLK